MTRHRLSARIALLSTLLLPVVTLNACAAAPDGIHLTDQGARASQVPGIIDATHTAVARAYKHLAKHPDKPDLAYWVDPAPDFLDGYITYNSTGEDWSRWYVTGTYGGGETDGAYYYNSGNRQYYVCGSENYLTQNWHVSPANRTTTCPRALADNVDSDVISPSQSIAPIS